MAKFDTYILSVKVGDEKTNAELRLTVLFEDGDDIDAVIQDTRNRIKSEAILLKRDNFIKDIEQ